MAAAGHVKCARLLFWNKIVPYCRKAAGKKSVDRPDVFAGGKAGGFFKALAEIAGIIKTCLFRDVFYIFDVVMEHLDSFFYAGLIYKIIDRCIFILLKTIADVTVIQI